ncbi:unnamed protein product [Parajaminaea phylloscopi]
MPATLSAVPSPPASPPPTGKFSTITGTFNPFGSHKSSSGAVAGASSGITSSPARNSIKNLFGEQQAPPAVSAPRDDGHVESTSARDGPTATASPASAPLSPKAPAVYPRSRTAGSPKSDEGPWSVSVAEAKEDGHPPQQPTRIGRRAAKKKTSKGASVDPAPRREYVLYVTNATHNLTLHRSASDVAELHQRLQEGTASAAKLPDLPIATDIATVPAATQTGSRRLLQTISRTLSPGASRSRVALSQITGSLAAHNGDASPSPPSIKTPKASAAASPSTPSTPATPQARDGARSPPSQQADRTTAALASYFTTLSNRPDVRASKAWRRFIRVRTDDLESVRIERRVHRVRSDLASHVKSSVAPTNTNVGSGPSQSDLGEDNGRTEDEREAGSLSGTSTGLAPPHPSSSRSSTDRPEVPVRTTSVDATAGPDAAFSAAAKRSSPNFAQIPEETERETSAHSEDAGDALAQQASSPSHQDKSSDVTSSPPLSSERTRTHGVADTSADTTAVVTPSCSREKRKRRLRREAEKVTVDDFEMIRVLGKGCAGKVLLVRHRPTEGLFAMKSIHKRHVLAHQELQHTLTEQAVLKRMAREVTDPFVVKLWWSFHDKSNLYLVMDFHPGGDLATQLSRWGRLGRDRARFYAAEIVEGVEGLHRAGVIYRDLKPENVLIGADGHIVLSDFGLSKEFSHRGHADEPGSPESSNNGSKANGLPSSTPPPSHGKSRGRGPHWMSASEDAGTMSASEAGASSSPRRKAQWGDDRDTTTTFCGTAEYLAPEVIQGSAYSYEVDWWSFGTMLYEMLVGITPFWADTHSDMYVRVLHDELVFPDERVLDTDTKSILRGLLQRNPMLRMKEPRIKRHPYFSMIEWAHVFHKRYIPPYIPPIDPSNEMDTQNFDEAFLDMRPVVHGDDEEDENGPQGAEADSNHDPAAAAAVAADQSVVESENKAGDTSQDVTLSQTGPDTAAAASLFDGYSFRGRKDSESIRSTESVSDVSVAETGDTAATPSLAPGEATPVKDVPRADATEAADTEAKVPAVEIVSMPPPPPRPTVVVAPPEEDSEDDESAARNALLALAALEREANGGSVTPGSAQGTPVPASSPPDVSSESASSRPKGRKGPSRAARAPHPRERIHETDAEDADADEADGDDTDDEADTEDEWDLVDAPVGGHASESNGTRGQNLFSRGVVDTYRLLRRQDSTRITPSTSANSSSARPFSRLRQRKGPSASLQRPSRGDLTSGSAASLESGHTGTGTAASVAANRSGNSGVALGHVAEADNDDDGRPSDKEAPTAPARASASATAIAATNGNGNGSKLTSSSSSRIKRRFTTFFEQTTR